MMYLQTLLKKLGFDVDSLTNSRKFQDTILGFNPKFIVLTALGKKVNGLEITKSIVKRNSSPRVLLLKSIGQVFSKGELSDPKIDKVLESPVNILNLLKSICDYDDGLKYEQLSLKLTNILTSEKETLETPQHVKALASENEKEEVIHIKGGVPSGDIKSSQPAIKTNLDWSDRSQKYEKFLQNLKNAPVGFGGFPKAKIKDFNKKHRIDNRNEKMEKLDQHKKDFVKALYSHLKKV